MTRRVVLLPGWGLGLAPLLPLADALRGYGVEVHLQPLPAFAHGTLAHHLDALAAELPADCWLMGWSLGGMLAAMLAARQDVQCQGLVTLGSNARFVAEPGWPRAMAADTFEAFRSSCLVDPATTLKRFALLCSQGAKQPRTLSRALSVDAGSDPESLRAGLDVLAHLDLRHALRVYTGPRLHVMAERDALVPADALPALEHLSGEGATVLMEAASHAFVFEQADELAELIVGRMEAHHAG
ncbi:alpha/beta fold hydrolase [Pseudomonas matsuisoli]|uniref:Transporter n=1 Tax=Pseudomonas matsuisoli TaxID=1515666 RepID=A0A917Q032_9PSED|nr:alpha/beta fold hydrolase [Pseudomonas matsuisoli]GGK04496.1 transporter [Pseudomonas matsuisoli]